MLSHPQRGHFRSFQVVYQKDLDAVYTLVPTQLDSNGAPPHPPVSEGE